MSKLPLEKRGRWELGQQVKNLRLRRSWSQMQLSEVSGVSLRTVQRLERTGKCSHETLLAIAEAFEIDVRELTKSAVGVAEESKKDPRHSTILSYGAMPMLRKIKRREILTGLGVLYLLLLIGVLAYGALNFESLYSMPAIPRDEQTLNTHQGYHQFLKMSGMGLALFLGIWAAMFGLSRHSYFSGLLLLGGGVLLSAFGFGLLPWVIFRFDQYSAGFLWVIGSVPAVALSWLLVTVLGRLLFHKTVSP